MRQTAAEKLRRTISAGAYLEADQLLEEYRLEVEDAWREASSENERRAISTQVTSLLTWARNAALAGRSHTQSKVIQMSRRGAYAAAPPAPRSLEWDV